MKYTLVSDGSSDRALIPILTWVLGQAGVRSPVSAEWAELRVLPHPPRGLLSRVRVALDLYPCDLLFVHRDAENSPLSERWNEVSSELAQLGSEAPPWVAVVPVRMLEAWFLHNEAAIRTAAGNPRGTAPLDLPEPGDIESEPNPKDVLRRAILDASELNRRRRSRLNTGQILHRIAEIMDDFSALDALPAFAHFRNELARTVAERCLA